MRDKGLEEVSIHQVFTVRQAKGTAGSAVVCILEGDQAPFGRGSGPGFRSGFTFPAPDFRWTNRAALRIAAGEKSGTMLGQEDIYINVAGGIS